MTVKSTAAAGFTVQADQNPYLAAGATRVDAVVTVTATGTGAAADALEIVVVDVSGSMAGEKIRAARRATAVAIGELRDGVAFAVIAGDHRARQVYPDFGTARADDRTRAEAVERVRELRADGGTAIGNAVIKNAATNRSAGNISAADRTGPAGGHTPDSNGSDVPARVPGVSSIVDVVTSAPMRR